MFHSNRDLQLPGKRSNDGSLKCHSVTKTLLTLLYFEPKLSSLQEAALLTVIILCSALKLDEQETPMLHWKMEDVHKHTKMFGSV